MNRQRNTANNTDFRLDLTEISWGCPIRTESISLSSISPNAARYFLSITYNLTGDQSIREIIEKLPQE